MTQEPLAAKQVLKCDLHDYIEIACLFNYRVAVTMHNGDTVEGVAIDTRYTATKQECLVLQHSHTDGNEQQELDLTDIQSLRVLTENARFSWVNFS